MPKQAHTPGPWHPHASPDGNVFVTFGDGSRTICELMIRDGRGRNNAWSRDAETRANAALIAAAPTTLAELEKVKECIKESLPELKAALLSLNGMAGTQGAQERVARVMLELETALAKAEKGE